MEGMGYQGMEKVNRMPAEDLRRLQLIELDILLELDRICRRHKIQYWISAGTLLGAVRHGGFIPWDDDMDVRMMRKEYERFCKVCETELNTDRFFLQNYKTDPEYRWFYAKMRRKGTEYLRAGQEAIKCMSGVSLDIFVIDNVPDHCISRKFFTYARRACIKTLWSVVGATEEKNTLKRFLYKGLRHVNKMVPLSIMEMLAKWSNSKQTEGTCCIGYYQKNPYYFRRDPDLPSLVQAAWFDESFEIEFEGFMFYAFRGYKEYLRLSYGNYMELPPKEKRYTHPPKRYNLDVDIELRGRDVNAYMERKQTAGNGE